MYFLMRVQINAIVLCKARNICYSLLGLNLKVCSLAEVLFNFSLHVTVYASKLNCVKCCFGNYWNYDF